MGFIYLLHLYPDNPEKIYKLGKTKRKFECRLREYADTKPVVLLVIECSNCDIAEKELLKIFKKEFKQLKHTGREYFAGDCEKMKKIVNTYFNKTDQIEIFNNIDVESYPLINDTNIKPKIIQMDKNAETNNILCVFCWTALCCCLLDTIQNN